MIRTFIAISLPQHLRYILHSMGRGIQNGRPVKEEQLHLTLRFIGEIDGSVFNDIQESLAAVTFPSFSASVKGVGHFPPRGKPRVIWAGITSQENILGLRKKIEKHLIQCGIEPERRKFFPHITIARLNNTPLQRVGEFLSGNSLFESEAFSIKSFHLYSSKLTPKGAIHTPEQSYPL